MRVKTRSRAESYFACKCHYHIYACQNTLKSGVVLCKLANAIQPGAIKKINNAKMNFMMMENIENFCNFVQTKGVASQYQFVTIDLFEGKNMHQVLITLNDLKNQTEKL
ncbi:myophilin isoform X3 [Nematostella vectensis]|uniref:myophilin isoform X3 n=1 Tax=Nematostella vectensis TaxID=45351 RepID=UPI0020771A84|nr:myophilin isoform X3 [Nematostella vectensis]